MVELTDEDMKEVISEFISFIVLTAVVTLFVAFSFYVFNGEFSFTPSNFLMTSVAMLVIKVSRLSVFAKKSVKIQLEIVDTLIEELESRDKD